jgi:hypothetical protein
VSNQEIHDLNLHDLNLVVKNVIKHDLNLVVKNVIKHDLNLVVKNVIKHDLNLVVKNVIKDITGAVNEFNKENTGIKAYAPKTIEFEYKENSLLHEQPCPIRFSIDLEIICSCDKCSEFRKKYDHRG